MTGHERVAVAQRMKALHSALYDSFPYIGGSQLDDLKDMSDEVAALEDARRVIDEHLAELSEENDALKEAAEARAGALTAAQLAALERACLGAPLGLNDRAQLTPVLERMRAEAASHDV